MPMKEKVVIVTGASSGIGKAAAEHFCRERATVVLADTTDPREGRGARFADRRR